MNRITYIKNEKGEFVCPDCGETRRLRSTMFYHIKRNHTEVRDYVCTEPGCDKAFIQKAGLQQHMLQAHSAEGTTLLNCPCCNHSCKMKANLIIHIGRKHGAGWIPPSEAGACQGCKKQFSSETAYYYHAVGCFTAPFPLTFTGEPLPLAVEPLPLVA